MTRRRATRFLIGLAALLLVAAAALVVFRLPLAETLIRRGLAAQGLSPVAVTVRQIGLDGARLTDIALGDGREVEIPDLRLAYSLGSLAAGRVERVDISNSRLRLDLTGRTPPLGSLQGFLQGLGGTGRAAGPLPHARLRDARIEAVTPAGPVTLDLTGEVTPQAGGRIQAAFDLSLAAAFGARVAGRLTATGDPGAEIAGALAVSDGAVDLAATEIRGAQGEIAFRLQGLRPRAVDGRLAIGRLALQGAEVPGAVVEIAATPENARLEGRAAAGDETFAAQLRIEIADPFGTPRMRAAGDVRLDLAAPVAAPLWERLGTPPPDSGRTELRLEARSDRLTAGPARSDTARLDVDLKLTDLSLADSSLAAARIALPLELATPDAAGTTGLRLRDEGSFRIEDAALRVGQARLRTLETFAGRIVALDAKLPRPSTAPTLTLALQPETAKLELARPDAPSFPADVAARRLTVVSEPDGAGAPALRLELADGRVTLPAQGVAAEPVALTAALGPSLGLRRADFSIGALRHLADPPVFAPWGLRGTLRGGEDGIELEAEATGPQNQGTVTARGDLRPNGGGGRLDLRLAPVTFATGGPSPATFLPSLSAIRETRGSLSGSAELSWGAAAPVARAHLVLDGLSFAAPGARVSNLGLDLTFDSLYPPETPPDQRLSVARIDPGVPMRDLDLRFRILPGAPPKLAIRSGEVSLLDGQLSLAEVTLDPAAERIAVPLEARRLDLTALFKLIDIEGLAGEGDLSGRIPLVFAGGSVGIEGGHLAAEGPGTLRIRSEAARRLLASGGESTELVLDALEDFRYSELTLDIAKDPAADPRLTLSMLGHNPAVLEGYPIRFNVNLEGRTGRLLDSLTEAYSLSNRLLLRLWRPR